VVVVVVVVVAVAAGAMVKVVLVIKVFILQIYEQKLGHRNNIITCTYRLQKDISPNHKYVYNDCFIPGNYLIVQKIQVIRYSI
jgi:hypothetical protein